MERSEIMRRVRSTNTKPELIVRSALHRAGFRYRLHISDLPGTPDIVFPRKHQVIFVHGCWWHGHDCKRGARDAKTNAAYWMAKRARNQSRDIADRVKLRKMGWRVTVVWECQTANMNKLMSRLLRTLKT